MDDWDWDRDEIVDLDACEMTGDPQLDVYGYQSPKRRGGTGFTASPHRDWLAQAKADRAQREQRRREAVEANLAETRRRLAERNIVGDRPQSKAPGIVPFEPGSSYQPGVGPVRQPDLAPHVADAIAQGMPGRDLGWWRVDVDAYGRAVWQRVDAPGDGPRMTVEQTPAQPVQPQWRPVQRWAPAELTEPSPGTRVW
ncbi:MAG TPA: hypothetical protein VNY55_01760 [Mycobacterium sp.]|jgi:hypothetical protein|nr:hypothetical protein [Mycobacterium sp.]